MKLFHYTNVANLPRIMSTGALLLCESNISMKRTHAGAPVVWFTTHETPAAGHGLPHDETLMKLSDWRLIDKTRIRIQVELPKVRVTKFVDFARGQGMSQKALAELASAGGLYSWWVSTKIVEMTEWVEVRDLQDTTKDPAGRLVWFREGDKMSTRADFRELLAKHGRQIPKDAEKRKIRPPKGKASKAGKK